MKRWLTTSAVLLAMSGGACGDDAKRPIGSTCGDSSECSSGLCYANQCLDPQADDDGDGLINAREASLKSDPKSDDTDADGVKDADEVGSDVAPRDSDGDGIPDILESLLADEDKDCENDQDDATNDFADNRDPALVAQVCSRSGVCAAAGAALAVTCPGGLGDVRCDASKVPGFGPEVTCDGVDNDCNGLVDDGLECGPTGPARFTAFNPYWAIEDVGNSATLVAGHRVLSDVELTANGLALDEECVTDGLMNTASGGDPVRTFTWCTNEQMLVPASIGPGRVTVDAPRETADNPLGFTETTEARRVELFTAGSPTTPPGSAGLLIGSDLRKYSITPPAGVGVVGREANLLAFVRQSQVAPAALTGSWGVVALMLSADRDTRVLDYGVGAFFMDLAPGTAANTVTVTQRASLEAAGDQGYGPNGPGLVFREVASESPPPFLLTLAADGQARLSGTDSDLIGAVTPDADVIILTATTPEAGSARTEADPSIPVEASPPGYVHQVVVGVRRTLPTGALVAGRSYRVFRWELAPYEGGFGLMSAVGTLTFSEGGASVSLVGDLFRYGVGFAGQDAEETLPGQGLTLDVSFVEQGAFLFHEPGRQTEFTAVGFVGDGARVVVMGDHSADEGASPRSGVFALMIGLCTNCDTP